MPSIFDLLLAGANNPTAGSSASAPTDPMASAPPADNQVDPVVVTASRKGPPPLDLTQAPAKAAPPGTYDAPVQGIGANTAYNNIPQLNAIRDVENQETAAPPNSGLMGGPLGTHGATLRNMLGTLGDAFLVSSGHQANYQPANQRAQMADAMVGMDTDPAAAAARVAATGVPGAAEMADKMQQQNLQHQQILAQQAYTNQWREGTLADRQQNHQAQQDQAQQKTDDRIRSLNYGMLSAAAATGDPKKYAAALASAKARIAASPNSKIDPSIEYPDNPADFVSGYGMNANQVSRQQGQQATLDQRGVDFQQSDATRRRGQDFQRQVGMAHGPRPVQPTQSSIISGLMARDPNTWNASEKAYFDHATKGGSTAAVLPPGLNPGGGGQQQAPPAAPAANRGNAGGHPQYSQIYKYPSGRTIGLVGNKWVAIH